MSWLDYAIIGVIVASIAWGVWRGLMREVMSLAGWVLAFLAANAVAGQLGDMLPDAVGSSEVRILIAFAVVFVLTLSVATLVGMLLAKLFKAAGLGASIARWAGCSAWRAASSSCSPAPSPAG